MLCFCSDYVSVNIIIAIHPCMTVMHYFIFVFHADITKSTNVTRNYTLTYYYTFYRNCNKNEPVAFCYIM